jgi:chaperonin cofactor prefoldin
MEQDLINLVLGAVMACLGWFGKTVWDAVQELKKDLKTMEVDLPTYYVRKDELENRMDKIEAMLSKIYDKLETKADKHGS